MLHRPNPASGTPVYLQLIEQVKHSLLNGALQPGEGLPDVQQIATTLVVNPQSVERAYRQLTTEGVIERHPAGDCVSRTRFQVSASAGLVVRGARPAAARVIEPADARAIRREEVPLDFLGGE